MGKGRTKTYVDGFDEALNGGIPGNKMVLIKGSTGTMKSSLAYYILSKNASAGKNSLYITFEQDRKSLEQQMSSLGFVDTKDENLLHIFDLSKGKERLEELSEKIRKMGEEGSFGSQGGKRQDLVISLLRRKIDEMRDRMGFELVVIDSLDGLHLVMNPENARVSMFEFFEWMRNAGLTCLVVCEESLESSDPRGSKIHYEDFLADGIIELRMEPINNIDIQRRIRCVKMRGTKHSTDYYSFFYDGSGFEIARAIST